MAKKVLPRKLHKEFSALSANGDVAGIAKLLDDNNIDINATLFQKKANPEPGDYDFYLLKEVLEPQNMEAKLDLFIERKADIHVITYNGGNLLFQPCKPEYLSVVEKLISFGININHRDADGNNYLHHLIREYGDPWSLDTSWSNENSEYNWRIYRRTDAEFECYLSFIELMLKNGADPCINNNYDVCAMDWVKHRDEYDDSKWNQRLKTILSEFRNVFRITSAT